MKKFCYALSVAAAGVLTATAALSLAAPDSAGGAPAPAEVQQPVKLNPTKRIFEIEVPVKSDGAMLGNVAVKITPEDRLFIDATLLKKYLKTVIKPDILAAALAAPALPKTQVAGGTTVVGKKAAGAATSSMVQLASQSRDAPQDPADLGQEPPSYLPIETIQQRGIKISYNPQNIELIVAPEVDQRPTRELSFERQSEVESGTLEPPAYVSAFLNMRATTGYVSQSSWGNRGFDATQIDLQGAARAGSTVIEGEASLYNNLPLAFNQTYLQDYVFYRHGTRLVYDLPDAAMRIRVGDIAPDYMAFQTAPDLLGLSVQHTYQQLQPGKSIRPTGSHSFRIERPSEVDIIIDNVLFRHIRLAPGTYNLSELPLRPGANNVQLVISDDTGARQTLDFTAFSGNELLAPGISEWSFNVGIKSFDTGLLAERGTAGVPPPGVTVVSKKSVYAQREYFFDTPAATGFYRTGITTALTVDANVQGDSRTTMAGTGFALATAAGMFSGELSASETYGGTPGYAVHLGYGYDRFDWFGYKSTLRVFGEYRSRDYNTVTAFLSSAPYNIVTGASYTQQLPYNISAGLSASFSHIDKDSICDFQSAGDRWEVDLSLSKELWTGLGGSLSIGYGRDETAHNVPGIFNQNGFQVLGRLAWTPAAHATVLSSYDSRSGVGEISGTYTSENQGVGSWVATAQAQTAPNDQSGAGGAVTYAGNRGDVTVAHSSGLAGIGFDGVSNFASTQQRTTVSAATSFVFADGAWGIGRPVTNGFAIVTPHPSLDGSRVTIGQVDSPVAKTDWLGSAVVPSLTAYRTTRLPYDAPDAPTGYDLGTATYDIHAPYKAGYALQAGSAYTVTAIGTLQTARGEPIPLLAGTAREAGREDGRKVELFTNRVGRFGAQGLAPGRWVIEMPTEGEPTRYTINIPESVKGLHNAGVLKPASGQLMAEAGNGH